MACRRRRKKKPLVHRSVKDPAKLAKRHLKKLGRDGKRMERLIERSIRGESTPSERVLLTNQADPRANGMYRVTRAGWDRL